MTQHANDRVQNGKDDISVRAGLRLNGWDSTNNLHMQAVDVCKAGLSDFGSCAG